MPKSSARMLLILFILTLGAATAWSFGGKEDPLIQADRLIADQKYDEAILYISEFMKAYPDRFDEGQAKLRKVAQIRLAYNAAAAALLDTLINEPTNEEKKIAMIRELESFEKNPSPAIRQFISQTKELALFTYNRAKFEEIMAQGRSLIDQRRFVDAAKIYETGFELYLPEFYDSGIAREDLDRSLALVRRVGESIRSFETDKDSLQPLFRSLASAYESYATADSARLPSAETSLANALSTARAGALAYYDRRRSVAEAGYELDGIFARFQKQSDTVTENSFLPFAFRLILGRRSETQLEGVAGAMDAEWTLALGLAQTSLDAGLSRLLADAQALYGEGGWTGAEEKFSRVAALAEQGLPLLALWAHYAPTDLNGRVTTLGQAILTAKGSAYLAMVHAADSAAAWARLSAMQGKMDRDSTALAAYDPAGATLAAALAAFQESRAAFSVALADTDGLKAASGVRAERLASATASGFGSEAAAALQGALDGSLALAGERARGLEITAVARAAAHEFDSLTAAADAALAVMENGRALLNGLPSDDPDLPDALFKYPTRALAELGAGATAMDAVAQRIRDYLSRYRTLPPYLASAAPVNEWMERASSLASVNSVRIADSRSLRAQATEQKRLADSSRLEAERRVAEAQNALRANNFELARERIDRARDRYLASLSFEQNAALRSSSDRVLGDLAASIIKAQNDLVVADTRLLLNQGKSLYLDGSFDRAESVLLQARSRWSTTNASPEVEVEYWLKLVQTALSVKTGRDIPVTAPLYPEMSQILSLAKGYYNEGAALLARRDRVGALNQFAQARQKIAEVKVIFPLNQEARVLELRIDQLTDADAFNRQFARLFEEARTKVNAGTDLTTAYSDLKDLEAINPRYAGLRALIEQAEIKLGFRQPPPDPKAIAEARELVAAAQRIFDSGDTARFALARTQLERAILLDPNNESASRLKDRIATYIGGDQTIVLSASAEALYNEAVAAFSRADYIGARARLARLAASFGQAAKVQKVMDLDERLKALGY